MVNVTILPGLGSLLAGCRVGFIQLPLGLTGFALSVFWMISFGKTWWHTRQLPFDGGPHFLYGVGGVVLWLVACLWSLHTTRRVLHAARQRLKPPVLK